MVEAATAAATPLLLDLPDAIVIWEILVRLDPKSLLRCRSVHRAWRRVTSTRRFILANHSRQPTLAILSSSYYIAGDLYHDILAFDHRAAQVHTIARLDKAFYVQASYDGLLVLSMYDKTRHCYAVCNPATRQYAPLQQLQGLSLSGMYPHRPTGEYRLLLKRSYSDSPKNRIGFYEYVFALGSNQFPRYIGWPEIASWSIYVPAMVRDCLHWYPLHYLSECKPVIVFDTIAESFRQMRSPIVPTNSYIFEMGGTLGIHNHNSDMQVTDIWVLQSYESEVWVFKYRIELPDAEIRGMFVHSNEPFDVDVVSGNGDVLLLVRLGSRLFQVNTDGKLIESSYHGHGTLYVSECRLKQCLVQHTFFPDLEGYAVNASPFI